MYAKTLLQVCGFCLLASGLKAAETLIVADAGKHAIIQVSLQRSSSQPLVSGSSCLKSPQDVAHDSKDDRVYWTDKDTFSICRAFWDGSSVETVHNNTISKGVTIDVLRRKLFWANQELRTIESCNLNGSNRKHVVQGGINRPSDVVVDSEQGLLYWADHDRENFYKIERSSVTGKNRVIVLNATSEVTSLALDTSSNTLYFASESGNAIQALSLQGSKESRQIIWKRTVPKPHGLAVFGRYIYWSNTTSVYRADKISGNNVKLVRGNFGKALGITVFHSKVKTTSTDDKACLNGGVLTEDSPKSNRKCSCPVNYIGGKCQLRKDLALLEAVNVTLKKQDEKWHVATFKMAIATALERFCNKNKCSKNSRSKRDENGNSDVKYTSDDVIIFDGYPKDLGDSWLVKFVVVDKFGASELFKAQTLDKIAVEEAILENKGTIEKELRAQIVRINAQTVAADEPNSNATETNKAVVIAAGTIAAIVCLTIGITATLYIRKKRKSNEVETEGKEWPNYAFYDEEFQMPPPPPPPPPPPQSPSPPPVPSEPPPGLAIPILVETPLHEKNMYTQHSSPEFLNTNSLHRHFTSKVMEGIGKDTTDSGSNNSVESGVKSHFKRFKESFRRKSHKSIRSNSTPIKQRRAITLERNSLPRPHSDVLPKTRHHVYDVPRIHPQKAPMTLRALKPKLPPKEKKYTLERDLEIPDSSV